MNEDSLHAIGVLVKKEVTSRRRDASHVVPREKDPGKGEGKNSALNPLKRGDEVTTLGENPSQTLLPRKRCCVSKKLLLLSSDSTGRMGRPIPGGRGGIQWSR